MIEIQANYPTLNPNPIWQPPTFGMITKQKVKTEFLKIYCTALQIFCAILKKINVSNASLDLHLFKMDALYEYSEAELTNLGFQRRFQDYLKVPMLNLPKLQHLLSGNDLALAEQYRLNFSNDFAKNWLRLVELSIDSWINFSLEKDITFKKDFLKESIENTATQNKFHTCVKNAVIKHPNGVCASVVGEIFNKLKSNEVSLEQVVAEFTKGVGKRVAAHQSFFNALALGANQFQKRINLWVKTAGLNEYFFETINIKTKEIWRLNATFIKEDQFEVVFNKMKSSPNGRYQLSLSFDTFDQDIPRAFHAIFIQKQNDSLEIVDPNIGLLAASNEQGIRKLIYMLCAVYIKTNASANFTMRSLEELQSVN